MARSAWLAGVAVWAALAAGCVERRFVVTSDPPGALVLHNGRPIGAAPADDHFVFYGDHEFTLIKEGYETLHVTQHVRAPWYQFFPLDLISEALIPWHFEDVRPFNYQMRPQDAIPPEQLAGRAQQLRDRGKTIEPIAPVFRNGQEVPPPGRGPAQAAPPAMPAIPPPGVPVALPTAGDPAQAAAVPPSAAPR